MSNKTITRWFVSVVDLGEYNDYKPLILDSFDTYGEAYQFMEENMKQYIEKIKSNGVSLGPTDWDKDKMRVYCYQGNGAQWSIQDVEISI